MFNTIKNAINVTKTVSNDETVRQSAKVTVQGVKITVVETWNTFKTCSILVGKSVQLLAQSIKIAKQNATEFTVVRFVSETDTLEYTGCLSELSARYTQISDYELLKAVDEKGANNYDVCILRGKQYIKGMYGWSVI